MPHLFPQPYLPLLLVPSGISKNGRTHNHIILGLKEKEDYLTQVIPFSDEENEAPKDEVAYLRPHSRIDTRVHVHLFLTWASGPR